MDLLNHLANGFAISLQPLNLVIVFIGVFAGLFIGAMPGLGSVNGVAIVLPLTFIVPPSSAIILLAAIYYGAMYGGAVSSILLGIPGASTAVATTFDGRPMAQQGKAGLALLTAAAASFIGGTISIILFTLFAEPLADLALAELAEFSGVVLIEWGEVAADALGDHLWVHLEIDDVAADLDAASDAPPEGRTIECGAVGQRWVGRWDRLRAAMEAAC